MPSGLGSGKSMPMYLAGQKYHQAIPEVSRIDPNKLVGSSREGIHEVNRVSLEMAKQMKFDEPVEASVFSDGSLVIVDGHHRVAAAKQLGLPSVKVILHAVNAKGEVINGLINESEKLSKQAILGWHGPMTGPKLEAPMRGRRMRRTRL